MRPTPDPTSLLNAWLALEALQPQSFKDQEHLIQDDPPKRKRGKPPPVPARLLVPFTWPGPMPWETTVGDRQVLGLEPNFGIRWYVPLAFIKMEPAVERMVGNVEPDGPERERARGVAVAALACFDEQGFALTSKLLLSSFGWACGEILAGRIAGLHRYLDLEDDLRREIGEPLVERSADGLFVPTTRRGFGQGMSALMNRLNLPADILERPRVAIRVITDKDRDSDRKEPVDIINSFLLDDLHRVRTAVQAGRGSAVLEAYLAQRQAPDRRDVLADKGYLDELLAPGRLPPARWPAPKPAKLVTLQQAAVNAAMQDLADGGLMSINGPPGTGKTTLLRDVVAAVIVERADRLLEFENPNSAFMEADQVAEAGQSRKLYTLDPRLRGHGIVVASSNNSAVRNVSAELPLAKAVASEAGIRHFPGTANVVQGTPDGCWGLVAAVLGNRSNRTDFVERAWWDEDWGLERYFGAATGRVSKKRSARPPARIVEEEQPPTRPAEAMERWRRASLSYRENRAKVAGMLQEREQIRTALMSAGTAQQELEEAEHARDHAAIESEGAATTRQAAVAALLGAEKAVETASRLLDGTLAIKPGAIARTLRLDGKWRQDHQHALELMRRAIADKAKVEGELKAADHRLAAAAEAFAAARTRAEAAGKILERLREVEARCPAVCRGYETGPGFWGGTHEAIHTASPWADPDLTAARDEMFAAAMRLHRAFIDAAAGPMKSNLNLMMDHLKGKRIPSGADQHLGDLWDSLFLLVPLVSTTFASLGRLMDGMEVASIGWLIVDEAGQATPQAAVGGLWRSRRALIIGDPLQIEPVSQVPTGLVRAICDSHGAHPDLWAAPRASVQTLADAASPLMARMGEETGAREIGLPLLVHRRCQDPMFGISNEIAYGGLMVHAAGEPFSPLADALASCLPGSCWIHVDSGADKWSPQEGAAVLDILQRMAAAGIREPNLYLISPFREVADRLRQYILKSGVLDSLGIPAKQQGRWGERHVGTVHTFQGKEAEAVILVLGAPAEAARGSRGWAGGTPNVLNVAATRAKEILFVVGHHDSWSSAGVFAVAAQALPVVQWPFEGRLPAPTDHAPEEHSHAGAD